MLVSLVDELCCLSLRQPSSVSVLLFFSALFCTCNSHAFAAACSIPMDSDGEDSPKQSIKRKNKPADPILLSDDPMGEGSNHSWELSDSGNLKDRNMAINDLGVSIVTSDASSFAGLDGVASSDGDGILSVQSCESRTHTFPAQASDFVVLETIVYTNMEFQPMKSWFYYHTFYNNESPLHH